MAQTLDTLIKPEAVIGFVRSTFEKLSDSYQLQSLFPRETVNKNKFRVVVDNRTAVPAAMFRAWDTEGYNLGRQGVGYREQEIAPITVTMPLSEQETLNQLAYDTQQFGPIIDQLFDDLGNLTESVVTTFELLRGQVLSDARCSVKFNNGTTATIDYGLRSEHRVTAGTLWSNTGASDPLANMRTWKAVYRANRRKDPGVAYTTQPVVDYLLLNAAVRSLLATLVGTPSFVSVEQLNLVLRAHGLPQKDRKAAEDSHKNVVKLRLLQAGVPLPEDNTAKDAALDRLVALIQSEVGADATAIDADIEALKEQLPALFTAPETTGGGTPDSRTSGKPPGSTNGKTAYESGADRAEQWASARGIKTS